VTEHIAPVESVWTTVHGLSIHARVARDQTAAEAPPIVLVHGQIVSSRYMVPTAERLGAYGPVFAPDLPGFGKSAKPGRALTVVQLADSLAAWTKAVGLGPVVLLGNSVGCQVAVDFAVRFPERVDKLILVGPTMDPNARSAFKQAALWLVNATREPLPLAPIVIRDCLDAGLRRASLTFRYALADRIEQKLPRVRVPALVVRGSRDPVVPRRWAEEATALLPRGRLVVLPGAAHSANFSAAGQLVAAVRAFVAESTDQR
jgi:2-hydroxy-6-oxonona-2,4-dienedioate hydrolase